MVKSDWFGFFSFMHSPLYGISDSEHYKSQALRNAKEAYQIHQERVSSHVHTIRETLMHYSL